MQRPISKMAVVTAAMFCMAGGALAQSGPDLGKREYEMNCAVCHGLNGKGAGAYTDFLKKTPADLTTISKRNGGVFPLQRVYDVIDGRGVEIKAHGPRDMPIWGADYSSKAGEHLEYYPEAFARTRILALIDYLYRIQTK